MTISFRPITDEDLPFLKRVYRSTREQELSLTDWDETLKDTFIDQQFSAQHAYYQQAYAGAGFQLILIGGIPAGRLYLWESEKQMRIVDIALVPEFRNQGIGTSILQDLIRRSEETGRILSIHVEYYNPALNLYNRLGFVHKDQTGVYFYMERTKKT